MWLYNRIAWCLFMAAYYAVVAWLFIWTQCFRLKIVLSCETLEEVKTRYATGIEKAYEDANDLLRRFFWWLTGHDLPD